MPKTPEVGRQGGELSARGLCTEEVTDEAPGSSWERPANKGSSDLTLPAGPAPGLSKCLETNGMTLGRNILSFPGFLKADFLHSFKKDV